METDATPSAADEIDQLKLRVSNLEEAIHILVEAIEQVELHKKPHDVGVIAGRAIAKITY